MNPIHLSEKIQPENLFFDLDAADRFELIRQVTGRLEGRDGVLDAKELARDAITREQELSTGIDRGVAMPHARTNAVGALICAFVRPVQPIDFGSADGKPCDLIFFSAVPRRCVDQYLHLTAAIVRRLQQDNVIDRLRGARSASDVLAALGIETG
ncbi:MAG: PTS system mannose-specific EIIBCA component [Calditrichaeota bacterium]|nr:PTS system mannose-specific EIIBCA component [Calditrichota bacterium]